MAHPGITLKPEVAGLLADMKQACQDVMKSLVKENPVKPGEPYAEQMIVAADSLGPAFQYSRGLSVYFPWSRPSEDSRIMSEYAKYKLHTEFPNDRSWLAFLETYFKETQRPVSQDEDPKRFSPRSPKGNKITPEDTLEEDMASLVYVNEGVLNQANVLAKGDPWDKTGLESDTLSIKNYPRDTRSSNQRTQKAEKQFPLGETFGVLGMEVSR